VAILSNLTYPAVLYNSCGRSFHDSCDQPKIRATTIVAVGTTIADRPPHRSVLARLRIRLLSWMSGGKAGIRIRMQNTGLRNPPVQERNETTPSHLGALTATN
jgi:hypothetical protein